MANRWIKGLGVGVGAVSLLALGGVSFLWIRFPKVDAASDLKVEITPARLARGKYLSNHVALCSDCHSQRDYSRLTAPMVPGTEGKGGERFDDGSGVPGVIYASNITPAALSRWTDGELYRAMTEGVSRNGRPLFPLMPYPAFAQMSKEDLYSIIAYIRSLPAVENTVPEGRLDFPVSLLVRTMPAKANPPDTIADASDSRAYGKYLTTAASCIDCHSPREKGQMIQGLEFAGGVPFRLGTGDVVRSANITPDRDTGIGGWSREQFIRRFKTVDTKPVKAGEFNTPMPWAQFSGMSEQDLGAIFDYLQTLTPVKNSVDRFQVAAQVQTASR